MKTIPKIKETDRTRSSQELNDLRYCTKCDTELITYWWTLGKGSVSLRKKCEACGESYAYIIYHYEEAEQITFE